MSPCIRTVPRLPLLSAWPVLGAGRVVGCGVATGPAMGQSAGSLWTERRLDVVPRDSPPNTTFWDSWTVFTDGLAHIAYGARFRSGDRMRESVVFDGRRGPEFVYASRPAFSVDGRRLAFLGVTKGEGVLAAYLVVGAGSVLV